MATSNTQRTLAYLKKQGYKCAIVEKWNPYAVRGGGRRGIRQDMFGIIDIIALTKEGVLGVQSTGSAFSAHHLKLVEEKPGECVAWLQTPGTMLWLIGWRKVVERRGSKRKVWKPRIREYTLKDFLFEGV